MEQIPLLESNTVLKQSFRERSSKKIELLSIFEDCHNYIYANEGVLKEKAFREITKILFIKIYCEKKINNSDLFKITKKEYHNIYTNIPCKSFSNRIKKLYQIISQKSSLSIWNEGPLLSIKAMAYVVNQLQSVVLTDNLGDIVGQAFQTFMHAHQRGERGEFFTPTPVVQLAVQMIKPKSNETLIDPACGSGGFLLNAINYSKNQKLRNNHANYVTNNIHGIEFNPDVALSSKLLLEIEGGCESNIICGNSLKIHTLDSSYDIVLTNPPFGRRGKIEDPAILQKYDLGKKWLRYHNDWVIKKSVLCGQAPEILFIEKCLNLLKPEGRMATVVPDGLLQNPSLAFVRHWIKSKASILGVISLPYETFIPFGTGVKTSLMILKKSFCKKNVFFSKIKNIGYDVKGNINYKQVLTKNTSNHHFVSKIVDSDIEKVVHSYHNKHLKNKLSSISWKVKFNLLSDRWDAEHYSLKDMKMIEDLGSNQKLLNFVNIIKEKEDFSKNNIDFVKYVAISDIDRHGMKIADHQFLKINQLPSRASYKIFEGDILIAVSGANTGTEKQAIAIVTHEYEGAICSNGFAVLRDIRNIDKYFFLAFLKTQVFTKQVRRMMTGHAIPCISLTNLGKIIVPKPDATAQRKISKKIRHIVNLSQIQHKEMQSLKQEIGSYM